MAQWFQHNLGASESPFNDPFFKSGSQASALNEGSTRGGAPAQQRSGLTQQERGLGGDWLMGMDSDLGHWGRRMERLVDRMESGWGLDDRRFLRRGPLLQADEESDVQTYWSSSNVTSSSSSDAPPLVLESHTERRRVGDLLEEKQTWRDSAGNERKVERHVLGDKQLERVHEKNAQGVTRELQNVHQIEPNQVDAFEREWSQLRARLEPSKEQQAQLPSGGGSSQAREKGRLTEEKTAAPIGGKSIPIDHSASASASRIIRK